MSKATDNDAVTINPSFTEITARVLPLMYSDQAILWKRSPVSNSEGGMTVKRSSVSSTSSSDSGSPPHRFDGHESVDSLADRFQRLSISPPRRQKSYSLPSSPSRSIQLPPRSPSGSPSSTGGSGPFSGRRRSPSKLKSESHDPVNVPSKGSARAGDGSHCSCKKVGGVCGC